MLASTEDEICETSADAPMFVWKIAEPIEVVFYEFPNCRICARPTNPNDAARPKASKHLAKMKGQERVRQVLNHMVRVKCIDRSFPKRQPCPDICPNVDAAREKIGVDVDPAV